jgi:ABC-type multidrug transport system ATPase subunit
MAYLGLTDYPLYLDELGASLDEKHRVAIMDFVKNFVEAGECSQMFLISHYHSGHGVFSNAEVTVLDDTNLLTKPDNFNKHVTISNRLRAYKAEG